MLCVFPHFAGDVSALKRLLEWIATLGGCRNHDALLVADFDTPYWESAECVELAAASFRKVEAITNDLGVLGWPQGPNSLWATAAKRVNEPWFWCETDCVPLKPGWLDAIEDAYRKCGKPFMGAIVPRGTSATSLPENHLNGNAVYPVDAWTVMWPALVANRAFDISTAELVVPQACNTSLIQHFYGKRDLPPTFVVSRGPGCPENAFTLSNIIPESVVFHRNSDGTLIKLLREKSQGRVSASIANRQMIVVLPFCNKDAGMALKNIQWMNELHGRVMFDCLLSTDRATMMQFTNQITEVAKRTFRSVAMCVYDRPPSEQWPQAANWAFTHAATYIQQHFNRPWLWMEPDATALVPNWLDQLQLEYNRCKKSFMGPIVMGMGHMNGVGIYPGDFPRRCPNTMRDWEGGAFDTTMKPEMIKDCQDCGKLIAHVWGMHQGKPHPSRGAPIVFRSVEQLCWVPPGAVMFHREKQGSLVDMLRKEKREGNPMARLAKAVMRV